MVVTGSTAAATTLGESELRHSERASRSSRAVGAAPPSCQRVTTTSLSVQVPSRPTTACAAAVRLSSWPSPPNSKMRTSRSCVPRSAEPTLIE